MDWRPEYTIALSIVVLGLCVLIYRHFSKPDPKGKKDWEIPEGEEKDQIHEYKKAVKQMDEEIIVIANRADNFEKQTLEDFKRAEFRIKQCQEILKEISERLEYWERMREDSGARLEYLNQGKKKV